MAEADNSLIPISRVILFFWFIPISRQRLAPNGEKCRHSLVSVFNFKLGRFAPKEVTHDIFYMTHFRAEMQQQFPLFAKARRRCNRCNRGGNKWPGQGMLTERDDSVQLTSSFSWLVLLKSLKKFYQCISNASVLIGFNKEACCT